MKQRPSLRESIRNNIQEKRKIIDLTHFDLTKSYHLDDQQGTPLVIEPNIDGINLGNWVTNNKEYIQTQLAKYGAILFRNFPVESATKFEEFAYAASANGELFDEYGDLPRDDPGAKVYHSTPYPADKSILFHNESSHMHRWPMKIMFYCVQVAERGGSTPILDCRQVYQALDSNIIKKMTEKKLMYVRNFIDGLDVSWQQFFGTTQKERVEEYCRMAQIDFEWKGKNQLTTRTRCPAVVRHPYTGEVLFFNQIQLHHISCLDQAARASMLAMFCQHDLPRNVYYGDGTPIEDSVISEISAIYDQLAMRFQWKPGDVILLDNMIKAHARDPFEGQRKILVAMADLMYQKNLPQF
jgi:alpha-ketoglutarate-dependent taurine dioxygenase